MSKFIVRFGVMRNLGVFAPPDDRRYPRGAQVVVRSDRGLEVGEVLGDAGERSLAMLRDSVAGHLLRQMTADDQRELGRLREQARAEFQACQKAVADLGLEMELVDVEHIFGGERIVVYYLAENRVDFRQLVKVLAAEFQTRIEMRQIGVRDEAKLLADFGDCGQPVCCNHHLVEMPPVSMKMAKLQKATLDPTKISGRCGRLKCCLRFEYDHYEQVQKLMPPIGTRVMTAAGPARILGQEILARQVLVETEDRRRILVDLAEVTPLAGEAAATASASPVSETPQNI